MRSDDISGQSARHVPAGRGYKHVLDGLVLRVFASALQRTNRGRLRLTMPSGRSTVIGQPDTGIDASLIVNSYAALWKCLRRGALGFADGYMSGEIETDSLHPLFNTYFDNDAALAGANRCLQRSSWRDRWFHSRRANTRTGSRRNIAAHYDLGNEFYRLWLDAGLTYSSGIYTSPQTTLEAAQAEKYQRILAALELAAGHTVLEIGCGWGGFAEVAGAHGATVTGITISQEQFDEASARVAGKGLGDQVRIQFEDYRETSGAYDRLASIEMIEAVGEDNWPAYFGVIHERLKPGGVAVLQAITIRPDLYQIYRDNPDFIQRYIFPGGMLPMVETMRRESEAVGLTFEDVETFGASYARTLADWRRRFDQAWPRIEALGFDVRFKRMWLYYLAYCEVGFERGTIDVGLYRLRKPM